MPRQAQAHVQREPDLLLGRVRRQQRRRPGRTARTAALPATPKRLQRLMLQQQKLQRMDLRLDGLLKEQQIPGDDVQLLRDLCELGRLGAPRLLEAMGAHARLRLLNAHRHVQVAAPVLHDGGVLCEDGAQDQQRRVGP